MQVVEERLAQFRHQPPVLIRDSIADVLGRTPDNGDFTVSGMVRDGKINLFRDGLADTTAVTRALWHELLHYGLRRFLTKEQYIAHLNDLYQRDALLKGAVLDSKKAQRGRGFRPLSEVTP